MSKRDVLERLAELNEEKEYLEWNIEELEGSESWDLVNYEYRVAEIEIEIEELEAVI